MTDAEVHDSNGALGGIRDFVELGLVFRHEFGRYPASSRSTMFASRTKLNCTTVFKDFRFVQSDTLMEHAGDGEFGLLPVIDIDFQRES